MPRSTVIPLAVLAVVATTLAGFVCARAWQGNGTRSGDRAASGLDREVASLTERLEEEILARMRLEQEVARLSQGLEPTTGQAPVVETPTDPSVAWDAYDDEDLDDETFNEGALVAAGFSRSRAAEIRALYEEIVLEGIHEPGEEEGGVGAYDAEWFLEEAERQDARLSQLEDELGEEGYDWLLYAAGQSNRVRVTVVLPGSAASDAGLQSGDLLLAYDGERIATSSQVSGAARAGTTGEMVPIDFERDGQRHQGFIVRGSLGARIEDVRHMPEPLR